MGKRLKRLKLIPYPTQKLPVRVTLTPLGDRIKYSITGDVYCERQQRLLSRSGTFSRDDLVWNAVFGSRVAVNKFVHRNRVVVKKIPISHLGYKPCDWIKTPG